MGRCRKAMRVPRRSSATRRFIRVKNHASAGRLGIAGAPYGLRRSVARPAKDSRAAHGHVLALIAPPRRPCFLLRHCLVQHRLTQAPAAGVSVCHLRYPAQSRSWKMRQPASCPCFLCTARALPGLHRRILRSTRLTSEWEDHDHWAHSQIARSGSQSDTPRRASVCMRL
ncbi:hypothetical protein FKP32DRAFT_649058 [Trametes sanguinea]|nr:hypothetical protein FKP32DRAFT_649058 [Trametes sanguinea]